MPPEIAPASTASRSRRFLRAFALRLGLLTFGVASALLLGELATRILSNEGPLSTFRDAEIGRRFTRSWEGDCYVEEAKRVVHVRFNREGMRDHDWDEKPAAGALRVAVLGDSMVAALGVDADQRFTDLGKGPWRNVEVQNWGVPGSGPALAARLFETRVKAYAPKVVVMTWFVGNDLSDDWPPLGGRRTLAAELLPDGSVRWPPFTETSSATSEWLARHSRLYVWQRRMLSRVGSAEEAVDLRAGLRAFDASDTAVLSDAWRMAEAVLRRFASDVRAAGSKPVLLVLPCAEQIYGDLWERTKATAGGMGWRLERDRPDRRLAEIALRANLPVVDVGTQLLATNPSLSVDRPTEWLFLNGTGHLNAAGHDLVRGDLGQAISAALAAPGVADPEKPGR